jgi:RluA family pseudouridine synthase
MELNWIEGRGGSLEKILELKSFSRRQRVRLKKQGGSVLVNGMPVPLVFILKPGDRVQVTLAEHLEAPEAQDIPLDVIYEDQWLLVVNKPLGLVAHPTKGYKDMTLANALAWHFQQQGEGRPARLVTRLDRETSGLVLAAKDARTHHLLTETALHKEYLAWVWGTPPAQGEILAPLGRDPQNPSRRGVDPLGKVARTRYRVQESRGGFSLVRLWPITGRTHQLRIHMAHLGHPILGDFMYGTREGPISRVALHAARLKIVHPLLAEELEIEIPLPEDLLL